MSATFRVPFDLEDMALMPYERHEIRLEPTAKRVRAFFGDVAIADSTRVQLMFESGRLPVYYFPVEDVRTDLMAPGSREEHSLYKGAAAYKTIEVDGKIAANAAWRYEHSPAGCPDLSGLVAFHWRMMDAWYEEDEEVLAHARDPYHRIDVLRSTRRVQVTVAGQVVADSRDTCMLFETSLPVRYYFPDADVRLDLLTPSDTVTACAYKGVTGRYWDAVGGPRDIAWCYDQPAPEFQKIAGRISFFNDRAEITVSAG